MAISVYRQVLDQAQQLTQDEQLQLIEELIAKLRHQKQKTEEKPRHSVLELEGLGKEIWEGIDAQEYVNQERASWDG